MPEARTARRRWTLSFVVLMPLLFLGISACDDEPEGEEPTTKVSAACVEDADCGSGLRCNTEYDGTDAASGDRIVGSVCEPGGASPGCAADAD